MKVKILGSGCKKCVALANNAEAAAHATQINVEIEKVTDVVAIAGFGVMSTPGLVINEKVVASDLILTEAEINEILLAL